MCRDTTRPTPLEAARRGALALLVTVIAVTAKAASSEGNEYAQALRLTPDEHRGAGLYERCAACHQSSGHGVRDGSVPAIAGQHFKVVLRQLADMRDDERHNPRMTPFVEDSDLAGAQALADVAAYVSSLAPNATPQVGPGDALEIGEDAYHGLCSQCHGIAGRGDAELAMPRVQGQHYGYLVRQIEAFRSGERHTLDSGTTDLLEDLSVTEIHAIADYMSRMTPTAMPSRQPE